MKIVGVFSTYVLDVAHCSRINASSSVSNSVGPSILAE